MSTKRYHISCYDNDGKEVYFVDMNVYMCAIDAFSRCVRSIFNGSAAYSKVYLFDMQYPSGNLFIVAKYDSDFY